MLLRRSRGEDFGVEGGGFERESSEWFHCERFRVTV